MRVKDSIVTLWRGEIKNGFYKGQISDGRKGKEEGTYINSSYSLSAGGEVGKALAAMPERTRLLIKSGQLTNETYVKKDGTKASYPDLRLFSMEDFELYQGSAHVSAAPRSADGSAHGAPAAPKKPKPQEDDSDDLPF